MHETGILRGKLNVKVESIDDAVYMLDFIELIRQPENKIEEIEAEIRNMRIIKEFLDANDIMVESKSFMNYLHLLNWPRSFKHWCDVKKHELQNLKELLYSEMVEEKKVINQKIERFKEQIANFKGIGLSVKPEKHYDDYGQEIV